MPPCAIHQMLMSNPMFAGNPNAQERVSFGAFTVFSVLCMNTCIILCAYICSMSVLNVCMRK